MDEVVLNVNYDVMNKYRVAYTMYKSIGQVTKINKDHIAHISFRTLVPIYFLCLIIKLKLLPRPA